MQRIGSNEVHSHKHFDDWLVAVAVIFFYLLIIALTFFSAYWAFQYMALAAW